MCASRAVTCNSFIHSIQCWNVIRFLFAILIKSCYIFSWDALARDYMIRNKNCYALWHFFYDTFFFATDLVSVFNEELSKLEIIESNADTIHIVHISLYWIILQTQTTCFFVRMYSFRCNAVAYRLRSIVRFKIILYWEKLSHLMRNIVSERDR